MEQILHNLVIGFGVAVTPIHLLYALIGCLLGTLIGVLPGIGPVATIAMLLPITFHLPPTAALIMLAGIYYGAQYGGPATAILVNPAGGGRRRAPPPPPGGGGFPPPSPAAAAPGAPGGAAPAPRCRSRPSDRSLPA